MKVEIQYKYMGNRIMAWFYSERMLDYIELTDGTLDICRTMLNVPFGEDYDI